MTNELNRFGSALFASNEEKMRAGLYKQRSNSLLVGFDGQRPLFYSGMGGLLLTAGARGGKLKDILAYNLCSGIFGHSLLTLDQKGELAAISQDQTPDQKHTGHWNPAALHKLPQDRINPVDYITIHSPTLFSDIKVFCENMVKSSGVKNGDFFEGRAREILEALCLTLVKLNGVLTLPDLYRAINLIVSGGDSWLDFAFEMAESGFPIAVRIEEEIASFRASNSEGFQGILGELFKAFACLSDPTLIQSVSPPYTFSMAQLCEGDQAYQVYMMPPAEFVEAWGPVIKALFVAGMIYKSRAPSAPQQTWILDECAQLGAFPLVTKMFTYGAGIGIRPWAVFQSTYQMRALGDNADSIITSSAALRSYFAVRDLQTAQTVSKMLGDQTLEFDEEFKQSESRFARQKAVHALMNGADPQQVGMEIAHHTYQVNQKSKKQRQLMTPDEILNMPNNKQLIFVDGVEHPIYADRRAYFEQRFMAGRYHPNPHHPPLDRVRVKTLLGHAWRKVECKPVPSKFADYPQYRDGYWSTVKG